MVVCMADNSSVLRSLLLAAGKNLNSSSILLWLNSGSWPEDRLLALAVCTMPFTSLRQSSMLSLCARAIIDFVFSSVRTDSRATANKCSAACSSMTFCTGDNPASKANRLSSLPQTPFTVPMSACSILTARLLCPVSFRRCLTRPRNSFAASFVKVVAITPEGLNSSACSVSKLPRS